MNNVFSELRSTIPASVTDLDTSIRRRVQEERIEDLVARWQKRQTPELTATVLSRMKPTIDAALSSYASGNEDALSVKAAKLTLEALKGYDPKFGAAPSTFVFHNLKRLNRLSGAQSRITPVSEALELDRSAVRRAAATFEDEHDREPSVQELADLTGFSMKRINKIFDTEMQTLPESATLTENGDQKRGSSALNDDDYFEYVYSSVSPVDQKIMEWSSGKHGVKPLSNNDIARKLKLTPGAVSQHKNKIQQMLSDVRGLV